MRSVFNYFSILSSIVTIVMIVFSNFAFAETIKISGFTKAYQDVLLGLPEAGRIALVNVKEGQFVKKGGTLLHLDKSLEEYEVARRKLQLSQNADLIFARNKETMITRQYQSATQLMESAGVLSLDEYEKLGLELEQSKTDRIRLEVNKKLEKIELNIARERLERRILKAPAAGVIVELLKNLGESVQANEALVRLVDIRKGYFIGNAEQGIASRLKVGNDVCLILRGKGEGRSFRARIIFISPTIDTASGLVSVKAEFDNEDRIIKPGITADLIINISNELREGVTMSCLMLS